MNTKPVHGLRMLEKAGDAIADVVDEGEGEGRQEQFVPLERQWRPGRQSREGRGCSVG